MKNNFYANPLLYKMILLFTCFMLVILYNKSKAEGLPKSLHTNTKAIISFKQHAPENNVVVRFKCNSAAPVQLFIFTADGILIREIAIATPKVTITGLQRGYYLYECFNNDERINSGTLTVK